MSIHVSYVLNIEELPQNCIDDCSASGSVDDAVDYWRNKLDFTVDRPRAIACLSGYGAWETEELNELSDSDIAEKILWLACVDFSELQTWVESNPGRDPGEASYGSDFFCLE